MQCMTELSNIATQELKPDRRHAETFENRVLDMYCGLGSTAKKPGVPEKYGSWSRIPESANSNKQF